MVVHKSLLTLVYKLKDKSIRNNYIYDNLMLDTEYRREINCDTNNKMLGKEKLNHTDLSCYYQLKIDCYNYVLLEASC